MILAILAIACTHLDDDFTVEENIVENNCDVAPIGEIDMSVDEGSHEVPIEWWYWTGHLQDSDGAWYGFEQVFFQFEFGPSVARIAQSAISDIANETFEFDYAYSTTEGRYPAGPGLTLDVDRFTATGAEGEDSIHGETDQFSLDLEISSTKQPVFQHGNGYTEYPYGGYTYYYSRPRMAATGLLTVDGDERAVTGTGWFDHQWGDLTPAVDVGWDWFALQFDDNREIMLFVTRSSSTGELVGGSLTDSGCNTTEISSAEITATGTWDSEVTGCSYPSGWEIEVDGMNLTITPELLDQEVAVAPEIYWEGAVTISGDATGRGFVELTNYCE
jgi:predicted secreted hydrolase